MPLTSFPPLSLLFPPTSAEIEFTGRVSPKRPFLQAEDPVQLAEVTYRDPHQWLNPATVYFSTLGEVLTQSALPKWTGWDSLISREGIFFLSHGFSGVVCPSGTTA